MSVAELQPVPEAEQDRLRGEIDAILGAESISQNRLATELGVPAGTLSEWRGRKYRGNNAEVAAKVRRGLDTRRNRRQAAAVLPPKLHFVVTPTAAKIHDILAYAQFAPTMAVIAMGPGCGKTEAAAEYRRRNANVWAITAEPCLSGVYPMLSLLIEELGVPEKVQTRYSRAIVERVKGTDGLIVVDEAQHLTSPALDQLRSLYDKAGIGVALMGNHAVYGRLEGEGRQMGFAMLFSRVGKSIKQAAPTAADALAILDAAEIDDGDARGLLRRIARKPGGLRGLAETIRMARMLAGSEPLTAEIVRRAYAALSPQAIVGSDG